MPRTTSWTRRRRGPCDRRHESARRAQAPRGRHRGCGRRPRDGEARRGPHPAGARDATATPQAQARATGPRGTPADPDLIRPKPHWDNILTADELATLAVLCDIIIPADDRSPAASTVGAHNYINEHVSAPYDGQRRDLITVRGGLVWLDTESGKRFGKRFRDASAAQQIAICEDIHYRRRCRAGVPGRGAVLLDGAQPDGDGVLHHARGNARHRLHGQHPVAHLGRAAPEVLRHIGMAGDE